VNRSRIRKKAVQQCLAAILFSALGSAQSVSLNLSSGSGSPGTVVTLDVSVASTVTEPASVEWSVGYATNDISSVSVTSALMTSSISCNNTSGRVTCVQWENNSNTLANGPVATIALTIAPSTTDTSSSVQLTGGVSVSSGGSSIPTTTTGTTLTISPAAPVISSATTASGTVGSAFSYQITASNSPTSYGASGLPSGLSINTSSGLISGTPTGAGTSTVTLTAHNSGGTGSTTLTLTVSAAVPSVHFLVTAPASVTAGVPIQFTVTALNSSNSTVTNFSDSVQFSSSDSMATLPANATLTNGVGTFTATLVTVGSRTLTVSDVISPSFTGTSSTIVVSAAAGLRYVPVTPCRVVDTRNATGPFGGPIISAGTTRSFTIPSGSCGIPAAAQAYSLNVAVVPTTVLGYLTVWPTGQAQPQVATLNSLDGRIKSNAAIVPAGTGGAVSVYSTNDTQVILDINGYFVSANTSGALQFYPLTPCRLVDTRINLLTTGPLTAGVSRTLPILSSSCNVPASAQAYSLNVTVVPPGPIGYLTVYPTGVTMPVVATLNDLTGTDVANAAIVPAGTGGSINVYSTNNTDLVVDINGYFAPAGSGGLSLYSLPPCRVLDTRNSPVSSTIIGQYNVNVTASGCGGTPSVHAYVFNTTVVPSGPLGYLTLWAEGTIQPATATLNALDGAVTNNMAIVSATNGEISAYATNSTALILDLFGYFAP
jgi:hypothetical protein